GRRVINPELGRSFGNNVEVDGIRTYYLRAGSGPAVLLIHGASPGACSLVNWALNLEPLAALGFSVIAFDQPGFGYSENPVDPSLEFRVTHARAFIDRLNLERFHVIGNSQGAYVAARIALEDPRTGKLILVSSGTLAPRGSQEALALSTEHAEKLRAYTPSLEHCRALTEGTLFRKDLVTDDLVRLRYEMSIGKNLEAQSERRKAPPPRPIADQLPGLKAKTLILWGKDDRGAALERGLALFRQIPGAEFHAFDRCAHWVQWDQASRFHRIVADFLTG
ncbi:MAG TPA: alpha/beta fold hydrolase, partial [Candidatus Binatia bacterium]